MFLCGYLSKNSIILTFFKLRNFKISSKSIRFPVKCLSLQRRTNKN